MNCFLNGNFAELLLVSLQILFCGVYQARDITMYGLTKKSPAALDFGILTFVFLRSLTFSGDI
jgi:hypothetical protein